MEFSWLKLHSAHTFLSVSEYQMVGIFVKMKLKKATSNNTLV